MILRDCSKEPSNVSLYADDVMFDVYFSGQVLSFDILTRIEVLTYASSYVDCLVFFHDVLKTHISL